MMLLLSNDLCSLLLKKKHHHPHFFIISIWLLVFLLKNTHAQKLTQVVQVLGKISPSYTDLDFTELGQITGLCFGGMMLKTCTSIVPTDDFVSRNELLYYTATLAKPAQYCLQCCGTSPSFQDRWDLTCVTDLFTSVSTNVYGYEFRFALKPTAGDNTAIITCPIKRSACTYDGNTITGCAETDNTYLWGYTLTVNVIEYSDGLTYWRGVSSCSAVSHEKLVSMEPGDYWTETIYMNYSPAPFKPAAPWNLLWLGLFAIVMFYPIVRFCRHYQCTVCNRRLYLVPWPLKRCAFCLFLNADLPDPYMLEALEAKGRRIIDGDFRPRLTIDKVIIKFFVRDLTKHARMSYRVTSHYGGLCATSMGRRLGFIKYEDNKIVPTNKENDLEGNRLGLEDGKEEEKEGSKASSKSEHRRQIEVGNENNNKRGSKDMSSVSTTNKEVLPNAIANLGQKQAVPSLLMAAIRRVRGGSVTSHQLDSLHSENVIVGPLHDGDEVSVLSQGSAAVKQESLAGHSLMSQISQKTLFSYESLPSLPPFMKRWFDRNTKVEKYTNPHVLSHMYPKNIIFKAINEDGRKPILSAAQRKEFGAKALKKKRQKSIHSSVFG